MPTDPERELEEFFASKPAWVRKAIEGTPPLTVQEHLELHKHSKWLEDEEEKYKQILRQMPGRYKKYEKRIMREYGSTFGRLILGGEKKPGRPRDPKADEFYALQKSGKSYRKIAESGLAKDKGIKRRIESESERIRQAVRRARQRKGVPPDPVQN